MAIKWQEISDSWVSSDFTAPVNVDSDVQEICDLLEVVAKGIDKPTITLYGVPMMNVTFEQLNEDGYDKRELFGLLLAQLKVHKKIWRVISQNKKEEETSHIFETFFVHEGDNVLRYLKFKFPKQGNPLKGPTNLKCIDLDYHKNKHNIKWSAYGD